MRTIKYVLQKLLPLSDRVPLGTGEPAVGFPYLSCGTGGSANFFLDLFCSFLKGEEIYESLYGLVRDLWAVGRGKRLVGYPRPNYLCGSWEIFS